MTTLPTPLSKAEQALARAMTPEESRQAELLAQIAITWAKELDAFEDGVAAGRLYLLARRKTAELIAPMVPEPGRPPKNSINLETIIGDIQLERNDYYRRKKELEQTLLEDIERYIDECIVKKMLPSVAGFWKYAIQIIGETTGDEWYTPRQYIASVYSVMGDIDLDPASSEQANKTIQANTIYTLEDSGLDHDWPGRVFMNPPYSLNKPFAEKMIQQYEAGITEQAVVLVGAHGIETQWFKPYWDHTLCFTGQRIKFNTPEGDKIAGNINGSVFIYLGPDEKAHEFALEFNQHGNVVRRWP